MTNRGCALLTAQGILEQNFTPLDQQPSAANQRVLQNFLLTANKINLEQQRETGALELLFTRCRISLFLLALPWMQP